MLRYTRDNFLNILITTILEPLLLELELSSIPVIIAHQNAPAPAGTYLAIEYSGSWQKLGRSQQGKIYTEEIEDETIYKRLDLSEYLININLHEVEGEGDILTFILDYLDTPEYQEKFVVAGISFIGNGDITPIPNLKNNQWDKESVVELRFAIATGIEKEVNYVEQINFVNNIRSEE